MAGNIFWAFFIQVLFTVGIIVLFGFLIALCNRRFYANFGRYGKTVCYATGFIGTPVHELSHALMCVIFGHKINEIKLFQINSSDGTLGYVNHSYNKKNIYQRIGNFFIGVAPIIVISVLLFVLAYFLMPTFAADVQKYSEAVSLDDPTSVFYSIWDAICAFFMQAASWQWWVFLLVGFFLCPHMTLSGADMKNALGGLAVCLVVLLAVDAGLGIASIDLLNEFTYGVVGVASYQLCFLVLALMILLVLLIISFVFRLIFRNKF